MDTVKTIEQQHEDLAAELSEQGVEYVFASWIDVTGRAKSK